MSHSSDTGTRSNALLWLLLGFLATLAIGYFYVAPQVQSWRFARATVAAKQRDTDALNQQAAQIQDLASQLEEQALALKRLSLAVPNASDSKDLIASLDSISSGAGVALDSVQPGQSTGELTLPVYTVKISGSYSGIRQFLLDLQTNLRPMQVTDMLLANDQLSPDSSLVVATLTVVPAQAIVPKVQASSSGGNQ